MLKTIPEFPDYKITKDGRVWSCYYKKFRKLNKNQQGYLYITLSKNKKLYNRNIHRLVLETYIGPRPFGMECCHNNGNPIDNRLENLRWDSHKNNAQDSIKHGTRRDDRGSKHPRTKFTEEDVRMVIYMYRTGLFTQQEIADIYKVTQTGIHRIVNKKLWQHIWKKAI